MKPLVVFADAQAAALDALRAALADRSEPYAEGVTAGTEIPTERSPETPHLPFVLVALDGDDVAYPVVSWVTLRVTVWHADAGHAWDLAQLCMGLLAVHTGTTIRGVRVMTGPLPARDDATGVDLASFTVSAKIRSTVLDNRTPT